MAGSRAPKVYVPSLGTDPECPGLTLTQRIDAILSALHADVGSVPTDTLLDTVLLDSSIHDPAEAAALARRGITVEAADLSHDGTRYDPDLVARALVAMA